MHLSWGIKLKDDGTVEIIENIENNKSLSKREAKGKSSTVILTDYTIIDIETTGLDARYDEIIELSAVRIRANEKQAVFQSLVHPTEEIDDFITDLTGITNKMLETAPSLEEIMPSFLDFIDDDIVVGHNVNFDINFIYDNSMKILNQPFKNNFIDTMRLTKKLFPKSPNHKLMTLAKFLNLSTLPNHRSTQDCETTLELYRYISKYVNENNLNLPDLFKPCSSFKISEITTDKVAFNENHPLFDKLCVFTGTLEKMQRKDAMQLVVDLGGHCSNSLVKKTNYLVLGNLDYSRNIKDGESSKLKKARSFILDGNDLQIISENTFYDLVNMD